MRNFIDRFIHGLWENSTGRFDKSAHAFRRALAHPHGRFGIGCVKIDAAHAGLRSERNERRMQLVHFACAQSESFLR